MESENDRPNRIVARGAGLVAGPLVALAMLLSPPQFGMPQPAWEVAAVTLLMAIWWMTEAAPLAVTALLPIVLFPLLGTTTMDAVAATYAHPLIFLFLGGFLLASAVQKWQLDRRLALSMLRLGGGRPSGIVLGLMVATAFLSMWVSNTATAMLMLPIGQSVIAAVARKVGEDAEAELDRFSSALMLGIGYAATIGGMGTLIGTPPNALFAGFMRETYGVDVGFAAWMLIGIPAVIVLLPVCWVILTGGPSGFALPRLQGADGLMSQTTDAARPLSRQERRVTAVLLVTAAAWIFLPLLRSLAPALQLSDAGIAITAAVALFLLHAGREGRRLLDWKDAQAVRWDVLILVGGGLALAEAIKSSGLAAWLGSSISGLGALPMLAMVLSVAVLVVLLGELASNTAIAAMFLPIAGATAIGIGLDPVVLTLPVAMAASIGFMLPVATPPNAIVYGSGYIRPEQMLRRGALLDLAGVLVVTLLAVTVAPRVLRQLT